jgi:hypothetical protein
MTLASASPSRYRVALCRFDSATTPVLQAARAIATAILVWLLLLFLSTPGHAEFCYYKPNDPSVEKHPGYSWRQRKVDGQKCWYYARNELPKEDLIWLYDSREFDAEGKVTGRTLYPRVHDGGR